MHVVKFLRHIELKIEKKKERERQTGFQNVIKLYQITFECLRELG